MFQFPVKYRDNILFYLCFQFKGQEDSTIRQSLYSNHIRIRGGKRQKKSHCPVGYIYFSLGTAKSLSSNWAAYPREGGGFHDDHHRLRTSQSCASGAPPLNGTQRTIMYLDERNLTSKTLRHYANALVVDYPLSKLTCT